MSTRARIGIQQKSGRIIASYQHWDGYTGGLGYNLIDYWTDPKKVTEAIKLGDASKWGMIVGNKIDFDNRQDPLYEVQNVYYGRDRGEKNCGYKVYKDEADYIANGFKSGEQFIYLMKDTGHKDYLGNPIGTWFYSESIYTDNGKYVEGPFKSLEIDAVKDHIDILKRSYKLGEVA
jgi:hypothetical protein|tara:strand:- start:1534 stop:2061 length:528 start_codon:yes stop_codon:yes gene_type:complete